MEMWHVNKHNGPRRHSNVLRRIHLDRLHPGDAPVRTSHQRPVVKHYHLALDVATLRREVVLLPRRPGRLGEPRAVLSSRSGVYATALVCHGDVVRRVAVEVDQQ